MTAILPSNPRARQALVVLAAVIATTVLVEWVFPAIGGTRGTPTSVVFQSLVMGLVVSLSAAAIVLIYRSIRVINFAQIVIGSAGAQLTFQIIRYLPRIPFVVALLLGIGVAALTGVLIDLFFGRRFAKSPRLTMTVVTIAASYVIGLPLTSGVLRLPFFPPLASRPMADLNGSGSLRAYLPFPGFSFGVGHSGLRFGFAEVFAIEASVVVLLALAAFLRLTKAGVGTRAVAENTERAALLGVGVGSMTTLVWAVAGVLGAFTAILTGFVSVPGAAFGFSPSALLAPLVGAALARFRSIPVAVGTTILLIAIAQTWQFNVVKDVNLIFVGYLVLLLVGLYVARRGLFREELATTTAWEASEEVRPIPKEFDGVVGLRVAKYSIVGVLVFAILIIPFVSSTSVTVLAQTIALTGIIALSLVILTGWAGQVSLGQYGFVAMGILVGGGLVARAGVAFWFAVPITAVVCGAFALVIGIPALRIKGLLLGVVTFAFSIAADAVLFDHRYFGWLLPSGSVPRPTAFFLNFNDERSMYYLCVAAFAISVVVLLNLRRSRFGRLLIAVRENEANVQSFGVALVRTKLAAFVISGAMCGVAGAFFAVQLRAVTGQGFGASQSFTIFVYAIIGGVTSIVGVLLGVAYLNIAGYTLQHNVVFQFVWETVPLALLYIQPGGLIRILTGWRDAVLRVIAQRRQLVVPSLFADYEAEAASRQLIPMGEPITGTGLAALGGGKQYALDSALHAKPGMERV